MIAELVPRGEPGMDRLIALVLHLTDSLHVQTLQPEPVAGLTTRTTDHDDDRRHEDSEHPG